MKTVLAPLLLLSGCATVHERQVPDWPALTVQTHVVEYGELYNFCARDFSAFDKYVLMKYPLACSAIDFERSTCHIVVTDPVAPGALEHEIDHCRGWDHDGIFQRGWDEFKRTGKNPIRRARDEV